MSDLRFRLVMYAVVHFLREIRAFLELLASNPPLFEGSQNGLKCHSNKIIIFQIENIGGRIKAIWILNS